MFLNAKRRDTIQLTLKVEMRCKILFPTYLTYMKITRGTRSVLSKKRKTSGTSSRCFLYHNRKKQ